MRSQPPPLPLDPPPPGRRRIGPRLLAAGMTLALMTGVVWLVLRPAALDRFLPVCTFYRFTGLYCPGCGGTRAVDALLHGHVLAALRYNPITTLALPLIVALWARWIYKLAVDRPGSTWSIRLSPRLLMAIAIGLTLFMILRNLPWPMFDVLRPG